MAKRSLLSERPSYKHITCLFRISLFTSPVVIWDRRFLGDITHRRMVVSYRRFGTI